MQARQTQAGRMRHFEVRLRTTTAVALTTMLAAGLVAAAIRPSEALSSDVVDSETARLIVESTGMPLSGAVRLLETESAADDMRSLAQRMWPNTFAGAWRMQDEASTLVIGLKGGGPDDAAELRRLAAGTVDVEVANTKRSMGELLAIHSDIEERLNDLAELSVFAVGLAAESNSARIYIDEESPAEIAEELTTMFGDAIVIERSPRFRESVCNSRVDCHGTPLAKEIIRAGVEIKDFNKRCSTAFNASDLRFGPPGPPGVLTAGHCFPLNAQTYHGSTLYPVGTVRNRLFGNTSAGGVDAAYVDLDPNFWLERGHYYFSSGSQKTVPITSVKALANDDVGDAVCTIGITTNRRCGTIVDTNVSANVDGVIFTGMRVANTCTLGGDSGGPVVLNNQANGINNFSNMQRDTPNGPYQCQTSPRSAYTPARRVEQRLNVQIRTSY